MSVLGRQCYECEDFHPLSYYISLNHGREVRNCMYCRYEINPIAWKPGPAQHRTIRPNLSKKNVIRFKQNRLPAGLSTGFLSAGFLRWHN